jgi:hypothetical protein
MYIYFIHFKVIYSEFIDIAIEYLVTALIDYSCGQKSENDLPLMYSNMQIV